MLRALCVLVVLLLIGLAAVLRLTDPKIAPSGALPGRQGPTVADGSKEAPSRTPAELVDAIRGLADARPDPAPLPYTSRFDADAVVHDFLAPGGDTTRRRLDTPAPVYWDRRQDEGLRTMVATNRPLLGHLKVHVARAEDGLAPVRKEVQSLVALREITRALCGEIVLAIRDARWEHAVDWIALARRTFRVAGGPSPVDRQIILTAETMLLQAVAHAWSERGSLDATVREATRRLADAEAFRKRLAAHARRRTTRLGARLVTGEIGPQTSTVRPPGGTRLLDAVAEGIAEVRETRRALELPEARLQTWWFAKRSGAPHEPEFPIASVPAAPIIADALALRRLAELALELEAGREEMPPDRVWRTWRGERIEAARRHLGPRLGVLDEGEGRVAIFLADQAPRDGRRAPRFGTFRIRPPGH